MKFSMAAAHRDLLEAANKRPEPPGWSRARNSIAIRSEREELNRREYALKKLEENRDHGLECI